MEAAVEADAGVTIQVQNRRPIMVLRGVMREGWGGGAPLVSALYAALQVGLHTARTPINGPPLRGRSRRETRAAGCR